MAQLIGNGTTEHICSALFELRRRLLPTAPRWEQLEAHRYATLHLGGAALATFIAETVALLAAYRAEIAGLRKIRGSHREVALDRVLKDDATHRSLQRIIALCQATEAAGQSVCIEGE